MELKNNVKDFRIEKDYSQQRLADIIGVSRNTISSIERGEYSPSAKVAYLICIALEKKFEEVFYFDD